MCKIFVYSWLIEHCHWESLRVCILNWFQLPAPLHGLLPSIYLKKVNNVIQLLKQVFLANIINGVINWISWSCLKNISLIVFWATGEEVYNFINSDTQLLYKFLWLWWSHGWKRQTSSIPTTKAAKSWACIPEWRPPSLGMLLKLGIKQTQSLNY